MYPGSKKITWKARPIWWWRSSVPAAKSIDRGDKYYEYEAGGVKEYWLIDPLRKQAEFYLLGRDRRYQLAPTKDGIFHSVVLKGLWLDVAWLWKNPRRSVLAVAKQWKLT